MKKQNYFMLMICSDLFSSMQYVFKVRNKWLEVIWLHRCKAFVKNYVSTSAVLERQQFVDCLPYCHLNWDYSAPLIYGRVLRVLVTQMLILFTFDCAACNCQNTILLWSCVATSWDTCIYWRVLYIEVYSEVFLSFWNIKRQL